MTLINMLEIDGSEYSGSGTIVREAIPFCILTGQEIHLRNIRAKRDKPGLRPQHLKALEGSRLWLVEKILGAKWEIHESLMTVAGIGL